LVLSHGSLVWATVLTESIPRKTAATIAFEFKFIPTCQFEKIMSQQGERRALCAIALLLNSMEVSLLSGIRRSARFGQLCAIITRHETPEPPVRRAFSPSSEEHTSELQSREKL